MASSGKKKKGGKGKTVDLSTFLASGGGGGVAPLPGKTTNSWADEMEEIDEEVDITSLKLSIDRSVLPTAPRAARGPDVDMSKVPDRPPFKVFLGNLSYDVSEDDIMHFFRELEVINVRLPQDQGRMKGFGYAEFPDRQSLLSALTMNEGQLKNRNIRIDLAETGQGADGREGRRRDDGDDRTMGDWRRGPSSRQDDDRGGFGSRDDRYSNDRDRGYGGRQNDRYGDRDRGGFDRDRRGGGGGGYDDREGGRRQFGSGYGDRDRGGGGFDRNRGYSPPRDRFGGGGQDRDRGYERRDDGPRERPRLNLAPRTKPIEEPGSAPERSSIFGSAKPVNTTKYEEMSREERLKEEDKQASRGRYSGGGGGSSPGEGRYEQAAGGYNRDNRDSAEAADRTAPGERPRLNLQKRTKPVEQPGGGTDKAASIFGGAKPVDTAAKEREIEARLVREREREQQEIEAEQREKRLSSSGTEQRGRRDSQNSNEDEKQSSRRTRKLSSSSSGKGIRTVAPPPCVGSRGERRASMLSDSEDVFEDDRSPKTPPARKDNEPPQKLVPAPPPTENPWLKRMSQPASRKDEAPTSPPAHVDSSKTSNKSAEPRREAEKAHNKENLVPAAPPAENAWKRGKPAISSGETHQRPAAKHDDPKSGGPENAWSKGRPRIDGPPSRGGGRGSSDRGSRGGRGASRGGRGGHPKEHKPLPQSIDEMPKIDDLEPEKKDFVDSNKFTMLMDDDE